LRPGMVDSLNNCTVSHFWLSARCETTIDTCPNCATMGFRLSQFETTGKTLLGVWTMVCYSYTIRCASSGGIIVNDHNATESDVRAYRQQFASPLHYRRMVEIVFECTDDDDSECF
jgi:hypothetical protein